MASSFSGLVKLVSQGSLSQGDSGTKGVTVRNSALIKKNNTADGKKSTKEETEVSNKKKNRQSVDGKSSSV